MTGVYSVGALIFAQRRDVVMEAGREFGWRLLNYVTVNSLLN